MEPKPQKNKKLFLQLGTNVFPDFEVSLFFDVLHKFNVFRTGASQKNMVNTEWVPERDLPSDRQPSETLPAPAKPMEKLQVFTKRPGF